MSEDSIAILVPLAGILMIIAVVVGPVWINAYFRARDRVQLHETLRLAYEKGQPPPPELIEKLTSAESISMSPGGTADRDLRRAVVLIAVGLGLCGLGLGMGWGIGMVSGNAGAGAVVGGIIAGSGAIPGFIGLAYLLLWRMERVERKAP
ncbi:MAG TPA: DUF6249 domain-containing protein [Caulobacteraceae bacterium]|nr:DUF6249 domain-containing protein [Caulobacteraceae bacterium]